MQGRAQYDMQSVREVVDGLDSFAYESAAEAVREWKFTPGRKNGQPVPVELQVEVTFRIVTP